MVILHADMDAFYAAVEQRDNPELRGKPVVVGGPGRRGVVSTCSYEARKFGIHSAMPGVEAQRRCPHAIFVPPRMQVYAAESATIQGIFQRYTPLVEPLSLDEAFMDVTGSVGLFGDGATIARRIKDEVREATELTVSVGVAPCKYAAKVASDLEKPDGLVVVPANDVPGFLAGAGHHGAEAAAHGAHGEAALGGVLSHGALLGLSSVISLAGVALAYLMYMAEGGLSPSLWAQRFRRLHAVLLEKWYVDEAYDWLVVRPLMKGARWLWKWLDLGVIDGAVNGAARLLGNIGGAMSAEQRGFAPTYMLSMAIGAVATLAFMLARRGF